MGRPGHSGVTLPQSALKLRFKFLIMAQEAPGDLVLARPPTLSHPRALRPSGLLTPCPRQKGAPLGSEDRDACGLLSLPWTS